MGIQPQKAYYNYRPSSRTLGPLWLASVPTSFLIVSRDVLGCAFLNASNCRPIGPSVPFRAVRIAFAIYFLSCSTDAFNLNVDHRRFVHRMLIGQNQSIQYFTRAGTGPRCHLCSDAMKGDCLLGVAIVTMLVMAIPTVTMAVTSGCQTK